MRKNYVVKGRYNDFLGLLTILAMGKARDVTNYQTFSPKADKEIYFHFSKDTFAYCFWYEDCFKHRGVGKTVDYLQLESEDIPTLTKQIEMMVSAKMAKGIV